MELFSPVTSAIIPVIIFFSLGLFLKNMNFLQRDGWAALEKIVYYLALPALIIFMMTRHKIDAQDFIDTGVGLTVALLAMFTLSFLAWFHRGMTGERFAAIILSNTSINIYVAIAVANSFLDGEGVTLTAFLLAAMFPISNLLGVCALLIWGKPGADTGDFMSNMIFNPMIIACAIGGVMLYFQIELPEMPRSILALLGDTALPLGLIAAGAGLEFGSVKDTTQERLLWTLLRLILLPCLAVFSCKLFGIHDKNVLAAVAIIGAAPTGTASYVLVKKLGGDGSFSSALIAASALFSFVTMPLILIFLLSNAI